MKKSKKFLSGIMALSLYIAGNTTLLPEGIISDNFMTASAETTNTEWKDAYVSFLLNSEYTKNNSSARFMPIYIDDDDIPELAIAEGDGLSQGVQIVTYHNGEAKPLSYYNDDIDLDCYFFGGLGTIQYQRKGNVFHESSKGNESIFSIENGMLVKRGEVKVFDYDPNKDDYNYRYLLNEIEVSKEEYTNAYKFDSGISYYNMINIYNTYNNKLNENTYDINRYLNVSGTCGKNLTDNTPNDNLTWELDSEGTLTISGTGDMQDYEQSRVDWGTESINKVVINEGVTSIGILAFANCRNLTDVIVPESVTRIGYNAFYNTPWLISQTNDENPFVIIKSILIDGKNCSDNIIVIPDNVKFIEISAFQECENLEEITISSNVEVVRGQSFADCTNLKKVFFLNPECEIETGVFKTAFSGENAPDFKGTIYGYENSTAQAYAEEYGYTFESLGDAPESEYTLGDLNNDAIIDSVDASAVLGEYAELSTNGVSEFDDAQKKSADVNNDGIIDAVDATLILSYYAEISTGGTITFPEFIENNKDT